MNEPATIVLADYQDPRHQAAIPALLDEYARDPMGGGEALEAGVLARLVGELARRPGAFTVLAFVADEPVGLVNCFEGFSTFRARPLVNIHDVVVREPFRGRGVSTLMLERVEAEARARGCCKLTLEVLSNNTVAKVAYQRFGFADYQLDPEAGIALFWQKALA
ncbi:MAG: GNAT family N-acetyltransferase [Gammaproteobacteria bacterium]